MRRVIIHATLKTDVKHWTTVPRTSINNAETTWRIIYRLNTDAIIIGEVFSKKTGKTPQKIIDLCKRRFRDYDNA